MERALVFYDDPEASDFYPLSLSHPSAELICGALTLGGKWSRRVEHSEIRLLTRHKLASYQAAVQGLTAHNLKSLSKHEICFINPRFLPDREAAKALKELPVDTALYSGKDPVAIKLTSGSDAFRELENRLQVAPDYADFYTALPDCAGSLTRVQVDSAGLKYLWDLVAHNRRQLMVDFELIGSATGSSRITGQSGVDANCLLYNPGDIICGSGCQVDGQVALDARDGPILLGRNVAISPHTRVEGPAYLGESCRLVGGKIRAGCSFGPHCRVGGEVEESIFLGWANKYHDGFIGHAYVGTWVNFGAMTTNSDLKNNYGKIKVELPSGLTETGLTKVGSFVGDHSKTGIGTLLTTGMVIGFSVNLFGGGLPKARALPSFVWGGEDGFTEYLLEKAIATARVVLDRRDRTFEQVDEEMFAELFALTATQRQRFLTGGGY